MRRRALALLALALLGCRSRGDRVAALVADLGSADAAVADRAARALVDAGEPAVPALAAALADPEIRRRSGAASVLWALGSRAAPAAPSLAAALGDPEAPVRLGVAMALANMGAAAEPAVPALVTALSDGDGGVRLWAVKALGAIGPPARSALPALAHAARNDALRSAAEEAMRSINRP